LTEAKTATGGSFHSNGKVLVLKLANAAKDSSTPSSANSSQTLPPNSSSPRG
jgi:hypothetical protein